MRLLQAQRFADNFIFLESPKWRHGKLWVSDVFDHRVYSISPQGDRDVVCEVPQRPSGLGFLPDGSLVIVSSKDRKLLRLRDGRLEEHADLASYAAGDVNDFAVDDFGRLYVGNFGYDYDTGEASRSTSLHRVDLDGSITEVAKGVEFPNGAVVINGGRTLVVAETWIGRLTAFDLSPEGTLSGSRLFADLGQRQPDGLCADAEGALWVACFNTGEFVRVLDGGEITDKFEFEGRGVSCTLGGADGHQLFLSTYLGPSECIGAGERKGTLFTAKVDIPASGF
ncbi:SMP-30/gluconolactonase/LRE family protein [Rhizobium sp. Leaf386]|uniref:SMP-30/gluconolactonase/LRE family protein n=1 Tax=Rhizobium sp. Leaf386 TaxID=1736359 RepID=UPI0007131454|nr:SMP-30/gluconolactonase/LRE family protein [Rhizobium sp. Leaf386]KQS95487.1 gluconolactonase [Rhizobium sp. Leaf386]